MHNRECILNTVSLYLRVPCATICNLELPGEAGLHFQVKSKGLAYVTDDDDDPLGFILLKQPSLKTSDFSKCFQFGDAVEKIFASKSACGVNQKALGLALR